MTGNRGTTRALRRPRRDAYQHKKTSTCVRGVHHADIDRGHQPTMRVSRMLREPHCTTPQDYQADPVRLPTVRVSGIAASCLAALNARGRAARR